ncbi:hypothetical protein [Thalassotalea atypica]|uniref:hypothetical protein n=1 Tax=Thalassotalea atypica TaxID=2054316 RepID=UPI0025746725|nr:hypothetical protein [Thalassotalea atypica]
MSFLKSIFSKEKPQRAVKSVSDLRVNDMIVLTDSFALPENLRNQQFQVTSINTYEFEHKNQLEWVLTGPSNIELFLSLEVDDTTELKISLKVEHEDVENLFDLDQFSTVFNEPGHAELVFQSDTPKTQGWTDNHYRQHVFAKVGYFHRKDHRSESLSKYEGNGAGEQFELYTLYNEHQSHGVDIEVWNDGDTDVFLILYRPLTDIVDMYPGS